MPELAASVEDLLAPAERREGFTNPDGRSTATFDRVWIDDRPHIVKYLHVDNDFLMRVSGDIGCRPVRAWAAGLLDSAPALMDHATAQRMVCLDLGLPGRRVRWSEPPALFGPLGLVRALSCSSGGRRLSETTTNWPGGVPPPGKAPFCSK